MMPLGHLHEVKRRLLIALLYLGLAGLSFEYTARILISIFDLAATAVYAVILGGLYRRYTRSAIFRMKRLYAGLDNSRVFGYTLCVPLEAH